MAHQNAQAYCNLCQKPTLHTRQTREVNHTLHLLLTLFCCGLWLPVWILDTIITSLSQGRTPFLCSICGQEEGEPTQSQLAQQAILDQQAAAERAKQRAESAAAARQAVEQGFEGVAAWCLAAFDQLCELPGQTNRGLRFIAGEGNDIVFRFLQTLALLIVAGAFAGMGYAIWFMAWKIVESI